MTLTDVSPLSFGRLRAKAWWNLTVGFILCLEGLPRLSLSTIRDAEGCDRIQWRLYENALRRSNTP